MQRGSGEITFVVARQLIVLDLDQPCLDEVRCDLAEVDIINQMGSVVAQRIRRRTGLYDDRFQVPGEALANAGVHPLSCETRRPGERPPTTYIVNFVARASLFGSPLI